MENNTAADRATVLRDRILAEINAGTFSLGSLYLLQMRTNGKCYGCAVAAAAFAVGNLRSANRQECYEASASSGLISVDETYQLEMGYEQIESIRTIGDGRTYVATVDRSSPFCKLGEELRQMRLKELGSQ